MRTNTAQMASTGPQTGLGWRVSNGRDINHRRNEVKRNMHRAMARKMEAMSGYPTNVWMQAAKQERKLLATHELTMIESLHWDLEKLEYDSYRDMCGDYGYSQCQFSGEWSSYTRKLMDVVDSRFNRMAYELREIWVSGIATPNNISVAEAILEVAIAEILRVTPASYFDVLPKPEHKWHDMYVASNHKRDNTVPAWMKDMTIWLGTSSVWYSRRGADSMVLTPDTSKRFSNDYDDCVHERVYGIGTLPICVSIPVDTDKYQGFMGVPEIQCTKCNGSINQFSVTKFKANIRIGNDLVPFGPICDYCK